jgi:hypothetical protein
VKAQTKGHKFTTPPQLIASPPSITAAVTVHCINPSHKNGESETNIPQINSW